MASGTTFKFIEEGGTAMSNETTKESEKGSLSSLFGKVDIVKTTEKVNDTETVTEENSTENKQSDYELIGDKKSLKRSLNILKDGVRENPILAIDCEGEDLSRKGKLLLLSVATCTKAFLIDIKKLKAMPFDNGLRDILEDAAVKKLMFDCREDADILLHQFQVKLDGVLDIQLLDIMKEHLDKDAVPPGRRSERHGEVLRIRSLFDCIKTHLKEEKIMVEQKKSGAGSLSNWDKRPLDEHALEYAKTDVLSLFKLFDGLKPNDEEMKRLEIASAVYVDLKRSIVNRTYDRYEKNCFLPIDVIPRKGQTTFEHGSTRCTTCKRSFPYDEFSKSQIKKNEQKCRTCKRVKLGIDGHANRERNYDRYESYDYYDSDEFGYGYNYYSDHDYDGDYGGFDSDW